jgi:signal transduction histidine kinase
MYAELHGGKLMLASKLGEGTTVRISFPPQRTLHAGGRG